MCFRCVGLKFEMAENGRKWPFHQRKTKILGIIRFSYPYRAADQCNTTQHPPYGSTHVPRVRTSRQGSSGYMTRGMVEGRQVVWIWKGLSSHYVDNRRHAWFASALTFPRAGGSTKPLPAGQGNIRPPDAGMVHTVAVAEWASRIASSVAKFPGSMASFTARVCLPYAVPVRNFFGRCFPYRSRPPGRPMLRAASPRNADREVSSPGC